MMKTIMVTALEKQVLESLANQMYAELGYSDVGHMDIADDIGRSPKVVRGVLGSLLKKELVQLWDRMDDIESTLKGKTVFGKDPKNHIWYLDERVQGLAEAWRHEYELEPVKLIVNQNKKTMKKSNEKKPVA